MEEVKVKIGLEAGSFASDAAAISAEEKRIKEAAEQSGIAINDLNGSIKRLGEAASVSAAKFKESSDAANRLKAELEELAKSGADADTLISKARELGEAQKKAAYDGAEALKANQDYWTALSVAGADISTVRERHQELAESYIDISNRAKKTQEAVDDYSNKLKEEQERLEEVKTQADDTRKSTENLGSSTEKAADSSKGFADKLDEVSKGAKGLPGPIGDAVSGIHGMTKATLRFIATPLGATLALISAALAAVTSWFKRTEEGQNAMAVGSAYFTQVLGSLLDVVDNVGEWLYKAFTKPKSAMIDLVEFLKGQVINRIKAVGEMAQGIWKMLNGDFSEGFNQLSNGWLQGVTGIQNAGSKVVSWIADTNKKANERMEITRRQNKLDEDERKNLVERAKLEKEINELRQKAYDKSVPEKEREKAIKAAQDKTKQMYDEELRLANERYEIIRDTNKLTHSNKEDKKKEAEAEAELYRIESQRANAIKGLMREQNRVDSASAKAGKAEEKAAKEAATLRQKQFDVEMADLERQSKEREEAYNASREAYIASIKNAGERERAAEDEQHRLNISAINKEAEEMKKANLEAAKKAWEASNTDKTKKWADTDTAKAGWKAQSLTADQEKKITAELKKEYAERDRLLKERQQKEVQSMRDYMKEFGTLQQKRLAIQQEYDDKIADETDKTQREILEAQKKQALDAFDMEVLKAEIDWTTMFDGIGNALEEEMKATLDKVEKFIQSKSFRELDAKEKAEYVKMRNELVKKTGGGVGAFDFSIYHQIGEDMKAYQQAIRDAKIAQANHTAAVNDFKVADAELKEAEKNLAKAMNNIASNPQAAEDANRAYLDVKGKQQMADMVAKITGKKQDEAEGNVVVAQGNLTDSTTKAKQALDNFGDAISQMTSGSLRGFADGLVNLIAAIGGKNGNGLSGLGKAGGIIGAILSIIDAIGSNEEGLSGVVAEIIDKIVNVITSLIDKITNGDFFRDINTAVGEGIQKILEHLFNSISDIISNHVEAWRDAFNGNFGSGFQEGFGVGGFFGKIFGERDDEKTYAEIQEEISDRIEEANKALDRLTEQLEKSYGVDAINKAEEAQKQLQKNQSDMIKGLDAALWDNYGGGESDYRKWNRFGRDEGIIANLMQKYGLKNSDMSWNALFNENSADEIARMLDDIRNTDFDLWSRFKSAGYNEGAVREWMEQLADTVKESDDIQKALEEKLTTTTKDNVIDDFKESLYDLADGSEDATEEIAENWQKMVNRMVVDNLVMKSMQADLEKWYDDLVALQKKRTNGEIGDKEYKEQLETLKGNYQGIVNGAYASIEVFKKEGIIKPIEDADNEVKEYFEDLKDSWKSALADMTKTGKDWKNELIDQVLDDLVESSVMQAPFDAMIDGAEKHFDTFLLYLDDWNKRYKDVIEDQKLTDEERTAKLKKLIDEQSDAYDTQAAKSKKLAEGIGKDMTEAFSNSLDNLGDTLLDALLDTEKDAKQLGKEIGQTLAKEMLAEMLASEKYATKKEDIRKLWQNVLKSENGKWTDMEGVFGEAGLVYTIDEVLAKITELNDAIAQDEDIDKMAKKYQEWGKTLEDISTSFGDLHDRIMNSILDMENGIEDFANDMNQKLVKDLIEKQVFGKPIDITWQNEAYHLDNYEKYQENWTKRYHDIYNDVKLSEEERERLLQALVDEMIAQEKILNDAAEDFAKRYQKAKKDTTFTDMKDSFIDSLMDMEGSIEDFAKNMKETIIRHLIEGFMVSDKIQPMLDDLQKTFDYMMSQKGWTDQQRLDFMTKGGQDNEGKAYRGIDDYTEEWKSWESTVDGMLSYYGLVKKETDELLSSITSNLNSMLTDSEKTGKDFASSLKESVINSLIDAYTTTEEFQDKLAEVKKQMKEAIESGNPAKIEAAERAAENFYKTAAAGVKMYTDALDQAEQEQETIFDNMRDTFRSSIMDMTKTGKDFAQDLKKTFTEDFVDKFVMGEAFDKVMQEFEEKYLAVMDNKSLSKEERAEQGKQIIAAAQKYYEAQKAEAKTWGDLMGINSKEDQSAYMNTAQSFTYDQADLIGGMVTSILMGQTEGNKVRQEILATLRAMDGITNPNSEVFAEMSENISRSANYLSHIEQAVSRIDTAVARNAAAVSGILSKLS